MTWLLPLWLIQIFLAYKVYGWLFAYSQGAFPSIADEMAREDRGMSLLFACLVLVPGIGYLIAGTMYLTTGFAKYGWRS